MSSVVCAARQKPVNDYPSAVPNCAFCGNHVSERAAVCPECGHPRAIPPEPDRITRILLPIGRSGWAIAAGYFALFAIVIFPLAPVALILGVLAVRNIRRDRKLGGMGRAVFAIVVGSAWVLLYVGWIVWNVVRR